jgi:hypothetical protein
LHSVDGRGAGGNLDPGNVHLIGGLGGITAVSEEPRGTPGHGESGTGTGEPGEITDVREMRDEEAVEAGARDAAAQLAETAVVVHRERINQGTGNRDQRSGFRDQGGLSSSTLRDY